MDLVADQGAEDPGGDVGRVVRQTVCEAVGIPVIGLGIGTIPITDGIPSVGTHLPCNPVILEVLVAVPAVGGTEVGVVVEGRAAVWTVKDPTVRIGGLARPLGRVLGC